MANLEVKENRKTYQGISFHDLKHFELEFKEWRRNWGVFFEMSDNTNLTAHLSEIAPGSATKKHRHQNEAIIFIVAGRGYSVMHPDGQPEQRFDWQEGDIISPPLNWWHKHYNSSDTEPARYFAVTNTILMRHLNTFTIETFPGE